MVQNIRAAESALGSGEKTVSPVEEELRAFARRDIFATRPIAVGEIFTTENVAVLRRGKSAPGLPPAALPGILGRRATRPIAAHSAIQQGDVS